MRGALTLLLSSQVLLATQPSLPCLSIPIKYHDFGEMSGDQGVVFRFKLVNSGTAPLRILNVKSSCGCTSTNLGADLLPPGESSELQVSFSAKGLREGRVHKTVQVSSNDPVTPIQVLSFDADIVHEIKVSSDRVVFQDLVRNGGVRTATVHLRSRNGPPWKLLPYPSSEASYLQVSFRQEGNEADVDFTLDSMKLPKGQGEGQDSIVLQTSHPSMAKVTIDLFWSLKGSVAATPPRVTWAETAGRELRAKVQLRHDPDKCMRILSFRTTHKSLRVEGLGRSASRLPWVEVVLDGNVAPGFLSEMVYLLLDDPDQPEFPIRVTASLR